MEEEEEPVPLRVKKLTGEASELTTNLETGINAIKGSGQPLPKSVRTFFEPRFGYNFNHVRIHTDSRSAKLARQLDAEAFTVGREVYLGAGRYNPTSHQGKRLLAHELVHTIQQRKNVGLVQMSPRVRSWTYKKRGRSSSDNNCRLCPVNLGVDKARPRLDNGIELRANLSGHVPGESYDIKRIRVGGVWIRRAKTGWTRAFRDPGWTKDDRTNDDEDLTPSILRPHIYAVDVPSLPAGVGGGSATEVVQKGIFIESVNITTPRRPQCLAKVFKWHTIGWFRRAGAGWRVDNRRSAIGPGHITIPTGNTP